MCYSNNFQISSPPHLFILEYHFPAGLFSNVKVFLAGLRIKNPYCTRKEIKANVGELREAITLQGLLKSHLIQFSYFICLKEYFKPRQMLDALPGGGHGRREKEVFGASLGFALYQKQAANMVSCK